MEVLAITCDGESCTRVRCHQQARPVCIRVPDFLLVNTTPRAHDYFYFLLDDGDEMKGKSIRAVRTCDVPA